jgi:predicted metal-dependent phosphotriesterase family hydrolase
VTRGERPFVRTVLGDRDPGSLGFTHCHEHLFVFPVQGVLLPGKLLLDDYERTLQEVRAFRAAGGGALVDAQPFAAGRHAELLARLARDTGVLVVASTGLHRLLYYPANFWGLRLEAEELGRLFAGEITRGMYAYDPGNAQARRTKARAGLIKVAADTEGLTPWYRRVFEAAALAHLETGAPILTHAEPGAGGLEQARYLLERGVPARSVIISHLDRVVDVRRDLQVARLGVYLEYDTIRRLRYHSDEQEAGLILAMIEAGFGEQLLLGLDVTRERLPAYGGEGGLAYLASTFVPFLREQGVGEEDIHRMTVDNPREALSFRLRK